jgi:hypothetical protein
MRKKPLEGWFGILILLVLAAIAYLPLAGRIGYLNDDWYLMYDGHVGGPDFFHEVYRIDRPMRAFVMSAAFSLFGLNPLYYHLSAFVFRFLSSLGMLWLCAQLWPRSRTSNFLAALFFLVYPGFLSQLNPIDYQSQILSLACGVFSVALTVKAIQTRENVMRWTFMVTSILLGWVTLGLVDYFFGFEILRLVCVGLLFWRDPDQRLPARLAASLHAFLPYLSVGAGFLFWRLFIFQAERKATDIGLQIFQLFSSPLTGLWWLNYLVQDVINVAWVAWALPMYVLAFPMRLREALIGFGLAILAALILVAGMRWGTENEPETESGLGSGETREKIWVGLLAIIGGLLPILLANRHITLPDYSRYTLAASLGAALLLSAIIAKISLRWLQMGLAGFLVALAVLTHYGNAVRAEYETDATRVFWWQVVWRAPHIQPGVTLIASYPGSSISEDYFVWGPANFIYYPERQEATPLEIQLPSAVLTDEVVLKILTNKGVETPLRRGNSLVRDFGNIMILAQSSQYGCVRFINGAAPELSVSDPHRVMLIASLSNIRSVVTDGEAPALPPLVFGKEPEHGWCYYYQKADLARQQADWQSIPTLLDDAFEHGNYPADPVEWMPFLQAYAVLGDAKQVRDLAKLVSADKFLQAQACASMTDLMEREILNEDVQDVIKEFFCK